MAQSSYMLSNPQNVQWFCWNAHVTQILFVSPQDYCVWWTAHRLQKPHRSEQPHKSGKAFLRSRFLSRSINYSASQLWTAGFRETLCHTCIYVNTRSNMHPCCTVTKLLKRAARNLIAFFCISSEGKNIEHRENLQPPPKGEWNCGRSVQV